MSDQNPDNTTPPAGGPTPPPYGAPASPPPGYGAPASPPYGAPASPSYGAPASPPAYPGSAGAYPGQTQGYTPYPTGPKTNVLAVVSLVASLVGVFVLPFIGNLTAVITGHIALGQIKKTGDKGRGMALAGVIVGYAGLAFIVIITILLIAGFIAAVNSGYSSYDYDSYS